MSYTPLPIGVDDFEKLRINQYYYVDKSLLIKELLDKKGEVNLFTRPRRFGKTLNLSMLRYFFEQPLPGEDTRSLFDGLKIMDAGAAYTDRQNQYPVISLSLKSAKQPTYELAYDSLMDEIAQEYKRHPYLAKSPALLESDRRRFIAIRDQKGTPAENAKSLQFLSQCLAEHHHKKVIILIDEYDVPLENAYFHGFYEEVITFIRSLFESALKTNAALEFSVITGCLRISKESIFTGLNNLKVISILNSDYDEYFGFTEAEVQNMLSFYHRESKMDLTKQWYDGYQFGNREVYNPWSVINFVEALVSNEDAFPTANWRNTSSNSIIKDLIYRADSRVKDEIERLVSGATIEKIVHEEITCEDIYSSEDNLWNFLFFTGYLKQISIRMEGVNRFVTMAIPNHELLYIYENTITNWFREEIKAQDLSILYSAILDGKTELFQQELTLQLQKSISYMDNLEAFYHGFLLGLLANLKDYLVKSNREAGNGRYDLCIYSHNETIPPVILELKVSKRYRDMEADAQKALDQIEEMQYDAWLPEEGYIQSIRYGVAFYKKKCRIRTVRKDFE